MLPNAVHIVQNATIFRSVYDCTMKVCYWHRACTGNGLASIVYIVYNQCNLIRLHTSKWNKILTYYYDSVEAYGSVCTNNFFFIQLKTQQITNYEWRVCFVWWFDWNCISQTIIFGHDLWLRMRAHNSILYSFFKPCVASIMRSTSNRYFKSNPLKCKYNLSCLLGFCHFCCYS